MTVGEILNVNEEVEAHAEIMCHSNNKRLKKQLKRFENVSDNNKIMSWKLRGANFTNKSCLLS